MRMASTARPWSGIRWAVWWRLISPIGIQGESPRWCYWALRSTRPRPRGGWWRRLTRAEGRYFALFELVTRNPDAVQAGGTIADELVPFVKGIEITEETWPAYKKSLEHTMMQQESYRQATELRTPALFVNGVLDFFIVRRNTRLARRANPRADSHPAHAWAT